jgi:hypothetical protein
MVVKLGCGLAIYKKTGSGVEEVFRNTLPESSGSVSYYVANYDGVDYIAYNSASSSGYTVLYKLSGKELVKARVSQTIDGEYFIDDKKVFSSQYESYLDSIIYPSGIEIEGKEKDFILRADDNTYYLFAHGIPMSADDNVELRLNNPEALDKFSLGKKVKSAVWLDSGEQVDRFIDGEQIIFCPKNQLYGEQLVVKIAKIITE